MTLTRGLRIGGLMLLGGLLIAGCASGGGGDPVDWDGVGMNPDREVQIHVENRNLNQATIYAIWGAGGRIRLGIVQSNRTEVFTTAWRSPDLKIEIRLLTAGTYETISIPVSPGEEMELFLTASMDRYRAIR